MKLSLRLKLILIGAIPLLFYVVTNLVMLWEYNSLYKTMSTEIYEVANQVSGNVLNADRDMYQAYTAYMKLVLEEPPGDGRQAAQEDMESNYKQAVERLAHAQQMLRDNGLLGLSGGESGRTAEAIILSFQKDAASWYEMAQLRIAQDAKAASHEKVEQQFLLSRGGINEITDSIDLYSSSKMEAIRESMQQMMTILVGVLIGLTLLLSGMVGVMVRRIASLIRRVVAKLELAGRGDLTTPRDERYAADELGQIARSVDDMTDSMSRIIAGIIKGTGEVSASSAMLSKSSGESAAAAGHVAGQMQEVAAGSEAQARGAQESSRAMEEMAEGISRIAMNTTVLADHAAVTAAQSQEGEGALERLVVQMNGIQQSTLLLSQMIAALETRSQQIGHIAENITAFAGQTNILSLNASIEAARAGEAGRGFAVVAAEIRKLAASSLQSAEGIHALVSDTQAEIDLAARHMAQAQQETAVGGECVDEVGRRLRAIREATAEVATQLEENSAIAEQMTAGAEQVSAAMQETAGTAAANLEKTDSVAAATEQQLALMENITDAARRLDDIVASLNAAVAHFTLRD